MSNQITPQAAFPVGSKSWADRPISKVLKSLTPVCAALAVSTSLWLGLVSTAQADVLEDIDGSTFGFASHEVLRSCAAAMIPSRSSWTSPLLDACRKEPMAHAAALMADRMSKRELEELPRSDLSFSSNSKGANMSAQDLSTFVAEDCYFLAHLPSFSDGESLSKDELTAVQFCQTPVVEQAIETQYAQEYGAKAPLMQQFNNPLTLALVFFIFISGSSSSPSKRKKKDEDENLDPLSDMKTKPSKPKSFG